MGIAMLLAGCAGPLTVDAPTPTGPAASVCGDVLADAPATVAGQPSVEVDTSGAARAWGDPAIVLRCGVDRPAAMTRASRCAEINRVGWFAQESDAGYTFTTLGRAVYVQVEIPVEYDPPADALVDLAATVRTNDRVRQPCV